MLLQRIKYFHVFFNDLYEKLLRKNANLSFILAVFVECFFFSILKFLNYETNQKKIFQEIEENAKHFNSLKEFLLLLIFFSFGAINQISYFQYSLTFNKTKTKSNSKRSPQSSHSFVKESVCRFRNHTKVIGGLSNWLFERQKKNSFHIELYACTKTLIQMNTHKHTHIYMSV